MNEKLVLASGSPRRRELLKGLGWKFDVVPSEIKEEKIEGESPKALVMRLASEKASDVASRRPGNWIIGADTIVVIDNSVLGKPHSREEAFDMLSRLAGREHTVCTGAALIAPDGRKAVRCEETKVRFRALSPDEINAYIDQGECMDKAGAYAIQDKGTLLVERINGCYFNVVGLPLTVLSEMFKEMGVSLEEQWRGNDEKNQ